MSSLTQMPTLSQVREKTLQKYAQLSPNSFVIWDFLLLFLGETMGKRNVEKSDLKCKPLTFPC